MSANVSRVLRGTLAVLALAALVWVARSLFQGARLAPADFTYINGHEVTTLDPQAVTGIPEGRLLSALFEGLCTKDPRTLAPIPGMAESWEISADAKTYTFHLRAGSRWTNGDEVDAHDFAYTFERLLNPLTAAEYGYLLHPVRGARAWASSSDDSGAPTGSFADVGIRALDARTLQVELEHPLPYFLELVAFFPLFPVNRRALEALQQRFPDTWRVEWMRPEHLTSNGPFRLVERRINDRVRLAKHAGYWDADHVALRTIDVLASDHATTNLNMYLTGAAGYLNEFPAHLVPRLREREDFRPAPFLASAFYRFNVTRAPFDDVRVRRALALAVDRRALTERLTKAGEQPLFGLVPPGFAAYTGATLRHSTAADPLQALALDCAEARALLAEAGFGPGGKPFPVFEIHYNTQSTNKDVAEVLASCWRAELGIECKLSNQEWKVALDTQKRLRYDVSRSIWVADYADVSSFFEIFLAGGENNRTGWANARYDELVLRAGRTQSDERMQLYAEAEAILCAELPLLPLFSYVTTSLVDPRLGGFHANALDEHPPKFWYWMDDAELERRRGEQPSGRTRVASFGPRAGLYAPAHARAAPR